MAITPKAFLDRYTKIVFRDPVADKVIETSLTGYGSGWPTQPGCNRKSKGEAAQKEYAALKTALQKHLSAGAANPKPLPVEFDFSKRPLAKLPPAELFYRITLINTFVGKGSPDEISDTLRLALATGRIGSGKDVAGQRAGATTLKEYMDRYITLDCNGLVGNYYGLNKLVNLSISNFAKPGKRRKTLADVKPGDCIVTHNKDKPYEHIALVDYWMPTPTVPDRNGKTDVMIRIVEWGQEGGESAHFTGATPKIVKAGPGPDKTLGIAFETKKGHYRYIFEPIKDIEPNGYPDTA